MTNLYNKTSEALWCLLEGNRDKIDISCVNFQEPFPIDQLVTRNPFIRQLIDSVSEKYNYDMSEYQCSWVVNQFIKGGLPMMEDYNNKNKTRLKPKVKIT